MPRKAKVISKLISVPLSSLSYVVEGGQVALGGHQEALVDAGVVEVVGDGGQQGDHRLHWSQLRADLLLLEEAVHRLSDIRCVHRVVVGIGVVVALLQKI